MVSITEKQNKLDPKYKRVLTVGRKTYDDAYGLRNEKSFFEPRNYPPSLTKNSLENFRAQ